MLRMGADLHFNLDKFQQDIHESTEQYFDEATTLELIPKVIFK